VRRVWSSGRARGVILVDALVGSVLLAIALTVVLGLAARALRAQAQGDRMLEVSALLDEQLNLVLLRGPDDYRRRFGARGECEAPFDEYSYELEFSGGTGGDPYFVRATISWEAPLGTRSESIETYIAPRLGDEPDPERVPDQPVERW
jgi:uncharacterized protein (DUF58 family)